MRDQRGIALVTLLIAMPVLVWLLRGGWQVAMATQDALQDQRAVDRAAYSLAAKTADQLNQMAINNQRIVAAHLLQGHLVTQLAWTRYVVQLTQRGSMALGWMAPQAGAAISQTAGHALQIQEQQMPVWTALLSGVGQGMALANRILVLELLSELNQTNQQAGQNRTRWFADPTQLASLQTQSQESTLSRALRGRTWLNTRSWSQSFLGLMRFNKDGRTQARSGHWQASDRLSFKVRRWFKTRTITLASGHADSRAYGYAGAASVTALTRDRILFMTRGGAHMAFAQAHHPRRSPQQAVLLDPDWDAALVAPL